MTRTNAAVAALAGLLALGACSSDIENAATTTSTSSSSNSSSSSSSDSSSTSSSSSSPPTQTTRTESTTGGGGGELVAYRDFESCDDFLEWTKEEMLERVTPYGLDPSYYHPWIWEEGPMPVPVDTEAAGDIDVDDEAGEMPTEAPAATVPASGDGGTSTTNTQEIGVDEGDITETDGRYVYSVLDDRLRSVDLDGQTIVSEIELRPGDHQLILFGDRLLVVTQDWSSGDGETVATQYSIADGALTFVSGSHLEGQLVAVRSIDGVARIVMQQPFATRLPFVQPNYGGEDEEEEALEQNEQVIRDATAEDLLPRRFEQNANGTTGRVEPALACDQVGAPVEFSGFNIVWVATVDLTGADEPAGGAAGVVATAEATYASSSALYVSTTVYPDFSGSTVPVNPDPPSTHLLAFDLTADDGADYMASGEVAGELLNQYSMSEHEGYLRVATTTWAGGFGQSQESGVHVLQRQDDELLEIGTLTGLGIGEEIQAVRFLGDIGYVVTFRRVDPLFTLDLSDPTAPKLVGELKVPGFSTYLHPVGDDRLLAIGYAGDDNGLTGDMQLSLFDVSDLAEPELLSTLDLIGWSEAAFDPHGFLYWPETQQVVVPKDLLCFEHIFDCTSAVVARIDGEELVEDGRLFSWWPIRRSMVAEGELVTVSSIGTKIWSLDTLENLADIRFDVPNTDADDDL